MEHLLDILTSFIESYGALGVFLASFVEEVIVPIPSTLVQSGAGLFILAGQSFSSAGVWVLVSQVALPAALGATLGSLVIYGLVYAGGMAAVQRFGRYFFLSESKILKARKTIEERKSLWVALTALRMLPLLPSALIAAGAGLLRVPLWLYTATTFVGFFVRGLYLGAAGWVTVSTYDQLAPERSLLGMLVSLIVGVLIVSAIIIGGIWYARRKKNNKAGAR